MELKLMELLLTSPAIFVAFAVLVWGLTYLVKAPVKRYTAKIVDEKKRKIANKWVLAIPFILALVVIIVYTGIKTNVWFKNWEDMFSKAFLVAVLAITWYNVFEGLRGKKTEYQVTDEGLAVYNLLLVYAKDPVKVKLLLDQIKNNLVNKVYSISETVKGFLPEDTLPDVSDTIVKTIERYFKHQEGGDLL